MTSLAGENKSLIVVGDKGYVSPILFGMFTLGIHAFCFEDTPLGIFEFCLGIEEIEVFRHINSYIP